LFRRGQELAARSGLILVDTKYEFGLVEGRLTLADEIHTPDSSRYWMADSYDELYRAARAQCELDKEPFRRWLMERGYSGAGEVPAFPDTLRALTALRCVQAYERIIGEEFVPSSAVFQAESEVLARIVDERLR
jgi:phosphoribosylaminoimidazole-succinocarboxamide synthase